MEGAMVGAGSREEQPGRPGPSRCWRRGPGILGALALLAFSAGIVVPARRSDPRPNLLLVSIDTLRADHLGAYGHARDTSPNLDALAARSVRFDEAWAPAPWTLPSHAALLTGRHPRGLGIANRDAALPAGAHRLAATLRAAGYRTAAFVDSMPGGFVGARRGFAAGFDRYVHLPAEVRTGFRYDAAVTAERAVAWLRQVPPDRPFFLFLHTKSVHALPAASPSPDPRAFPYDKPARWRGAFLSPRQAALSWDDPALGAGVGWLRGVNEAIAAGRLRPGEVPPVRIAALRALYDAGILYTDHHLGRVLDALERYGLAAHTAVVVTADHGEAFLEHELLLHKELHRGVLRVPLLVHRPGQEAGRVVREPVTLMDVAPTLLGLAGAPVPPEVEGRPLPLDGREGRDARPLFTWYRARPEGYYEAWGLREGPWSLVHRRLGRGRPYRTQLFHAGRDPGESTPVADQPARRRAMRDRLLRWKEQGAAPAPRTIEPDAETLRHLEALGYVR